MGVIIAGGKHKGLLSVLDELPLLRHLFNDFRQDAKSEDGMNDVLNKATVLVLNRNWQAIDVKTPAQAFCMMANGNATALDMFGTGEMRPVGCQVWMGVPVREDD